MTEKITRQEKLNLANRIMLDKALSPVTRLVGWYIADHIHTRRGYAWPPQTTIAKELGISLPSVKRAVKSLAPYFKIDRSRSRGRANRYVIGINLIPNEADSGYQNDPSLVSKTTGIGIKNYPLSFLYPFNDPLTASTEVDGARAKLERRPKKRKGTRQEVGANDFSKFWESYPRRVAKKAAEKAFARAIKDTTLEQMLAALAIDKQDWKEERFTPHPATWLNQGRYLDHQDKLKPLKTYRPPDYRDD